MQCLILQIKSTSGIAYPTWLVLSGQLEQKPITNHQFRWRDANRVIEDEELKIKQIPYKLSPPASNQSTQQAPKHPTSALKRIENLEIHKNPKFIHFQIGLNRKSSLIPPNPQIKVLNLCNSMLSMLMATEGLDLYVESMRC